MVLEILIEEVKQRQCLWKKSLEDYRNQNVRDNAWEQISEVLQRPGKYIIHIYNYIIILTIIKYFFKQCDLLIFLAIPLDPH